MPIDKKLGNKTHKMIYGIDPDDKTTIVSVNDNQKNMFCLSDEKFLQLSRMGCNHRGLLY